MPDLHPDLLDLLRCPVCKGELAPEDEALRCDRCRLRYRIQDGVPNMLADEAERLDAPAAGA